MKAYGGCSRREWVGLALRFEKRHEVGPDRVWTEGDGLLLCRSRRAMVAFVSPSENLDVEGGVAAVVSCCE